MQVFSKITVGLLLENFQKVAEKMELDWKKIA